MPVTTAIPAAPGPAIVAGGRLRHIDALRAIAALLVVCLHVTQSYAGIGPAGQTPGRWMAELTQGLDVGRVGVVLFFLISGYVIPSSLHPDRPAPYATFAIRRFFRIYPAYWLSIPFCAFATWWLWGLPFTAADFLVNLTLLQDVFGFRPASGVYWTLLVELVFYLLCIVLSIAGSLGVPLRIALLAGVLAAAHASGAFALWLEVPLNRALVFLPLHLSLMLCGTLLRLHADGKQLPVRMRWLLPALLSFYLVLFPLAAAWARGPVNNYVVSTALGLLLFLAGSRLPRLGTRWLAWLGGISYSIYLFHVPAYMPLYWWLTRQPTDSWWRAQHIGVYLVLSVVVTLVVAACVQRLVERPGIRLGHWLASRWLDDARIPPQRMPTTVVPARE